MREQADGIFQYILEPGEIGLFIQKGTIVVKETGNKGMDSSFR